MAPPVAIIVGTVIISVGAAVIITKHVWPHVKPHVQPQAEEFWRQFTTPLQRHREGAYTLFPDHDDLKSDDATAFSSSTKFHESSSGILRQRPTPATGPSILDEKLVDVEMVHLDNKASDQ